MIRNIQLKLPVNMQDKWTHTVGKVRKKEKREASFIDFVEFVETESAALNDPIYSRGGGVGVGVGVGSLGGSSSGGGDHRITVNSVRVSLDREMPR